MRVACKQLRHVSKHDRTGDTARILSIVLCALQAQEALSIDNEPNPNPDALGQAMDDEPVTWFTQVMELMLQAFLFLAELCEQYPVPFMIISQTCVILILVILFCACRPMSSTKLSLLESVRARVSAKRDGSIEVSIDARVSEGSGSGARLGSPEPAYPNSTTNPNASRAEPTEVAQPQAQAKAKAKSRS